MTPREKTVLRAVSRALRLGHVRDMDALATSLPVPDDYYAMGLKLRAAMVLSALVEAGDRG